MKPKSAGKFWSIAAAVGILLLAGGAGAFLLAPRGAHAQNPDGETLYNNNCSFCHGPEGAGGVVGRNVVGVRSCSTQAAIDHFVPGMSFLTFVSPEDLEAISDYLNARDVTPEQRYKTTCSGCHGPTGATPNRTGQRVQGSSAARIREAIRGVRAMRYLDCLPDSDADEIAAYLRDEKPGQARGAARNLSPRTP